ncbi:MAG: N-acetylmuramoyl-L-alanine amidase [Spirochaetes bacterium]|nr:N-acetylmuramoyl-L-alanine amidase [Spirochaetota bacterium]
MPSRNSLLAAVLVVFLLIFTAGMPPSDRPAFVPLASVAETLDLEAEFNATTGIVRLTGADTVLLFEIGSREAYLPDGTVVIMKEETTLQDGVLLLPAEGVDLVIRRTAKRPLRWGYEGSRFFTYTGSRPVEAAPRPDGPALRHPGGYEVRTVIIDAGHGGKDPGGIGYNDIYEKEIVLKVALELERELERSMKGVEILMTRKDDRFLSLEERARIANGTDPSKNPIYVSIHANVSFSASTKGYESYYLSLEPVDEEAREVASMENSVLGFEIEDYNDYLQEIINRIVDIEYRRESMRLAGMIQEGIESSVGKKSPNRGVKNAFFYVLKAVKMPSVLVEIGFVTNGEEALRLCEPEYERTVAQGVAEGIVEFAELFKKTEGFTR